MCGAGGPAIDAWPTDTQCSAIDAASWQELQDESFFRNRNLAALHSKLTSRVSVVSEASSHLPNALLAAAEGAAAAALEGRSFAVQVRDLWAVDGQKGTRARRKKALTDYLKQLAQIGARHLALMRRVWHSVAALFVSTMAVFVGRHLSVHHPSAPTRAGLSTSRSAVPANERSTAAWFATPQLHDLVNLSPCSLAMPPELASAWLDSRACYQQAVACVQQLARCRADGVHSDVSQREATAMCNVTAHMLYLLRREHAAMHDAVECAGTLVCLHGAISQRVESLLAASTVRCNDNVSHEQYATHSRLSVCASELFVR